MLPWGVHQAGEYLTQYFIILNHSWQVTLDLIVDLHVYQSPNVVAFDLNIPPSKFCPHTFWEGFLQPAAQIKQTGLLTWTGPLSDGFSSEDPCACGRLLKKNKIKKNWYKLDTKTVPTGSKGCKSRPRVWTCESAWNRVGDIKAAVSGPHPLSHTHTRVNIDFCWSFTVAALLICASCTQCLFFLTVKEQLFTWFLVIYVYFSIIGKC